jgi:hypothetical protein
MISRHQVRWPLTMLGALLLRIGDCGLLDWGFIRNVTGNRQAHLSGLNN